MEKVIEIFAAIGFIVSFFACFFGIWAFKDFICDMKRRLEVAESEIEILKNKDKKKED